MRISASIRPVLVAVVAALLLAACGSAGSAQGNSGSSGGSGSSGSSTPTPAAQGATVETATATVQGKSETILTNSSGMTLYYYTPDKDKSVTCTGKCQSIWPPLTDSSAPAAPSGVTGTFGVDPNPAGGSVVTYNGWPLYTYAKDMSPGQTKGEGLNNSGGTTDPLWFVATPSLTANAGASGTATPTPSSGGGSSWS